MKKADEIKVFISSRDSTCEECGSQLGKRAWITLKENGAVCLNCADLDHLIFLPSGDPTLTRRSKKNSRLWAVVLKWSRARKRYERQGLLVEESALDKAEEECEADRDRREERRILAVQRRAEMDEVYIEQFSKRIRELFPGCPKEREKTIAQHACRKYSGRVERSCAAREFDENAVRLAVRAHIRHTETPYDDLLMRGHERWEAREITHSIVDEVMEKWSR
ncbi:MAG: DUF2293 domain-containing protein [Chitinispirillaceae bacterium]